MIFQEGELVRLKSGTEGWIKGKIVEYADVMPSVGGVIYIGPSYNVYVMEGKHKGETIRVPANYVQPLPVTKVGPVVAALFRERVPEPNPYFYTIAELKKMCRDNGLPDTGSKADLVSRLFR